MRASRKSLGYSPWRISLLIFSVVAHVFCVSSLVLVPPPSSRLLHILKKHRFTFSPFLLALSSALPAARPWTIYYPRVRATLLKSFLGGGRVEDVTLCTRPVGQTDRHCASRTIMILRGTIMIESGRPQSLIPHSHHVWSSKTRLLAGSTQITRHAQTLSEFPPPRSLLGCSMS